MAFMTKEEYEQYVEQHIVNPVTPTQIAALRRSLEPLIGAQFNILSIPEEILPRSNPLR